MFERERERERERIERRFQKNQEQEKVNTKRFCMECISTSERKRHILGGRNSFPYLLNMSFIV